MCRKYIHLVFEEVRARDTEDTSKIACRLMAEIRRQSQLYKYQFEQAPCMLWKEIPDNILMLAFPWFVNGEHLYSSLSPGSTGRQGLEHAVDFFRRLSKLSAQINRGPT